ncbi:uncharacterized protein LOC129873624 [Solanum dulcamara]|uniref:uncharacterized protein LOC129873624 n=1 Tax=Solanum dulcamara TaxID=45834 RepID=UPI00248573B0|nr:uncharacterized protein LOC129873624 [Solanum dulcamara]
MPLESDTCHSCGKSGHWARQCPNNSDFVGVDGKKFRRSLPCRCGAGSCKLFTSNTLKNPGRNFYRCPANDKSKCQFFKWADEVNLDEFINVPLCRCGADFCRVGLNAGRMFVICPIKKGHGACDFKLWLDSEEAVARSTLVNESASSSLSTLTCVDVSPASSDLVEECNVRSGVGHTDASPEEIYYHLKAFPSTTGPVKSHTVILEDLIGEDEVLDEPSRKHRKRLRYGGLKVGDTSLLSSIGCVQLPATKSRNCLAEERLHLSLLESEGEIHPIQTEVRKQIFVEVSASSGSFVSSLAHSSVSPMHLVATMDRMLNSIHHNLNPTFQGWWGRLVFPPPRSLMVPSVERFTSYVFPPEPIFIIQDTGEEDDASPATQPRNLLPTEINICTMLTVDEDVQLLDSVKKKPDGKSFQGGGPSSIMRCSISKVFLQAADCLQKDLLTLFESLDIKDHTDMIQEADATFAALDHLGVDRQHFSERVEAFISSVSALAKIECSISSDQCFETLVNHWISEKLKLDELSHAYLEAINASTLAEQHLLNLKTEAYVVRARLSQIEAELAHCEVENSALRCSLEHISEEKKQSEESLSIAFKELENAQELWKQREVERNAAMTAYETAKAMLCE